MTTLNIIESVQTVFPQVKETQIIKDLDNLQKYYANETKLLRARGNLSSPSSNVAWNLPADFVELYGEDPLRFYDSSDKPLYVTDDDYNYEYEIQFGKFYIYSKSDTPITGLDSGIDSAYIHYIKKPATLTSRSSALEIEDEFRKGLEYGLLADYFGKYTTPVLSGGNIMEIRDLTSASWHYKRFEEFKRKAKIYAKRKDYSNGSAQYYQHAGAFQLPRRINDSSFGSTTITQLTALGDIYTKYALYHITSSDGENTAQLSTGYSTISASKSGTTFTLSSTAEFGTDTQIVCNNDQVSWVYNSSSEIVITLPGSFTLISLEIYERI